MTRAHVLHFGCRLNQYESDALTSALHEQSVQVTESPDDADYVIINTCTVTNRADQKNRSAIRSIHRLNPRAKIIVTGCYATTDAEILSGLPGVYSVVPNLEKAFIPSQISGIDPPSDGQFSYRTRRREGNSRAYLKIQDGCNKSCSYCKIPSARGKGRSRSYEDSLNEARQLIEAGFREIILTGVNIGWYQSQRGNFYDLLEEILELPGEFIVRVSSIEPADVNERFARMYEHPRMAKFLHIPLQSGSRDILRAMHRGYTPRHFEGWVEGVRRVAPDLHVGTDLIVGFPGETEQHFTESLEFLEKLKFANIHVFPFSLRRNTPVEVSISDGILAPVHGNVIRERVSRVIRLRNHLAGRYLASWQGRTIRGILEGINPGTDRTVVTENYLRLQTRSDLPAGSLIRVRIESDGTATISDGP